MLQPRQPPRQLHGHPQRPPVHPASPTTRGPLALLFPPPLEPDQRLQRPQIRQRPVLNPIRQPPPPHHPPLRHDILDRPTTKVPPPTVQPANPHRILPHQQRPQPRRNPKYLIITQHHEIRPDPRQIRRFGRSRLGHVQQHPIPPPLPMLDRTQRIPHTRKVRLARIRKQSPLLLSLSLLE